MFPYINTPFFELEVYYAAPVAGAVIAVLLQMFLLYRWTKKIISILYAGVFGICSWLGAYGSTAVRLTTLETVNDFQSFWQGFLAGNVKHYLGEVIVIALLAIPLAILFHKVLPGRRKDWSTSVLMVTDAMAPSILLVWIFARIGCLARGCCFGIPYTGIFAIRFPQGEVSYAVFPTQIFEIACALLLFAGIVFLHRKKKPVFGVTLVGYAVIIFISEFFMDKRGTHTYYDFSMIQFFAVLLLVLGTAHIFYLKKLAGGKR
jgi:prolipoprotein diacylglyceryltransferase